MSENGVIDVEPEPVEDRAEDLRETGMALRPVQVGMESLEQMTRRQEIIELLMKNALKRTTARHWLNYGDIQSGPNKGNPTDPRPEDEACVAIARDLGVSWVWVPMGEGPNDWTERKKSNGATEVLVTIRGHCFGQIIEEVGSCATDDPLLKYSKRAESRGDRALFSDVLKKARANGIVRLVQAFGVRSITWEDLEAAGIERKHCDRVDFAESEDAAEKGAVRAGVGQKCPKCGKALRLRDRKDGSGQFLSCSGYPHCRYATNLPDAPKEAAQDAPGEAQTPEEAPGEPEAPNDDSASTENPWEDATPAPTTITPEDTVKDLSDGEVLLNLKEYLTNKMMFPTMTEAKDWAAATLNKEIPSAKAILTLPPEEHRTLLIAVLKL